MFTCLERHTQLELRVLSRDSLIVRSQGSLPFTPPHPFCVHVCSLSHQSRVLLLSLSRPFCVYVRSLSLSLRGYMVSHRSSLLRRSGRTALVVVHPLPNRQAPCRLEQAPARRWRRPLPPPGRQAGFGSPHVARNRPDRLLPGSTADEARCCCYYYYCYCY